MDARPARTGPVPPSRRAFPGPRRAAGVRVRPPLHPEREELERRDEQRVAAIKTETDRLTLLLEANTDLTRQDKDLTEQVADLTKQIHALLTAR